MRPPCQLVDIVCHTSELTDQIRKCETDILQRPETFHGQDHRLLDRTDHECLLRDTRLLQFVVQDLHFRIIHSDGDRSVSFSIYRFHFHSVSPFDVRFGIVKFWIDGGFKGFSPGKSGLSPGQSACHFAKLAFQDLGIPTRSFTFQKGG